MASSIIIALALSSACAVKGPKGEPVTPVDGVFSIPASGVGRGEVRFFRYETGGRSVVFFVARSPEGDVKTAFDACITCYPHRMGYRREEDCVVCVFCESVFRIDELDVGKGNCIPIKIEHRLEGERVLISQSEVEAGAAWF